MAPSRLGALLLAGALGLGSGVALFQGSAAATPSEETCFLAAINATRTAAGVAPLVASAALAAVARAHSQQMASAGLLSHNASLPNQAPFGWLALGENVGNGPSCDAVTKLMSNDPAHRANIVNPEFDAVGVGVVDTAGGSLWVTEDFLGIGAPAPVPSIPIPGPLPIELPAVPVLTTGGTTDVSRFPAVVTSKAVRPSPVGSPNARTARVGGTSAGVQIPIAIPIVVAEPPLAQGILSPVVRYVTAFFGGFS